MKLTAESSFDRFVTEYKNRLRHIARHSRVRLEFDDVKNQSWIIARGLCSDVELTELWNPELRQQLIARVYNTFVKYADPVPRNSVMLDSGNEDSDGTSDAHPLTQLLTADDADPLQQMVDQEQAALSAPMRDSLDIDCSLAGAYLWLHRHFNNWQKVAEHLDISPSTTRKHYQRAEFVACRQRSLLFLLPKGFMPGTWQRWRLGSKSQKRPRQLDFEFTWQLPLKSDF